MTTKKELIYSVADRTGVKKSGAELVLNATLAEIERALLAGQPVEIAASTTVAFKPAKALKDSLN